MYNFWLLVGLVTGILCRGKAFFYPGGVVLLFTFLLFRLRMMGAGDGKLMALIVGFLGFDRGILAVEAGFLVGAVWSLCRFRHQKSGLARLYYLRTYIMCIIQKKTWLHYDSFSEEDVPEEKTRGVFARHRIPLGFCLCVGVNLYFLWELAVGYKGGIG